MALADVDEWTSAGGIIQRILIQFADIQHLLMKKITLSETKQISLLITGKHPECPFEFDSKTIASFFQKAGVGISEIAKYRDDEQEPFFWVMDFVKYLASKENFTEILEKYFEETYFYNPQLKGLVKPILQKEKSSKTVGVFMDFDDDRKALFKDVFAPTLQKLGLTAVKVDQITNSGEDIHQKISQMMDEYSIFIVDISGERPNKFIELGELLAMKKNIILLKEEGAERPFNICHLSMIDYPKASQNTDKTKANQIKLGEEIQKEVEKFTL